MAWISEFWRRVVSGDAPPPGPDVWSRQGGVFNNGALLDLYGKPPFRVAAALCAGRVIAEGVAQMPRKIKRQTDRVRADATDHPAYGLVHRRPNPEMTAYEFFELLTLHAVFCGVGRAYVARGASGDPLELWPLAPEWTTRENPGSLEPRWRVTFPNGPILTGLSRRDLLEVRGPSWLPTEELGIAHEARAALGLAADLEAAAADLAERRGLPHGVLEIPAGSSKDNREALKKSWAQTFGPGGRGGVAVLDLSAKFAPMQMTGADAQAIENRKFQIDEIARAFRVFPQMLMHGDKTATYASASEFFLAHVIHTLGPWVERWEHALDLTLCDGADDLYAHFVTAGLLRGSPRDRAEYYAKALGSGGHPAWMTPNEIRALEELNPIEGGDALSPGAAINVEV